MSYGRQMEKKRKFIKYGNRKIYDADEAKYISMEDLLEVVREGHPIEVSDDVTGEDFTVFTLARLVYEACRQNKQAFDRKDLQRLISKGKSSKAEAA